MQESPEIEAVIRRAWDAVLAGDHDAMRKLSSSNPNARYIASADDEWWRGGEGFVQLQVQRSREIGFVRLEFDRLEAFEHGDVGWAAGSFTGYRPSGDGLKLRFAATLMIEAGMWRIVQWHTSKGIPNAEVFGSSITKTLDGLVSSLDGSSAQLMAAASPTGNVTLMFTDIEDSTRILEQLGDEEWAEIISEHLAALRAAVERRGGTVVKTLGDGAMAAFGSVKDALSAAVSLQQAFTELPLKVRIGVHTGKAFQTAGDYVGITVNKAARIASAAAGGEILASCVTAELAVDHDIELGPHRVVHLKGLDGTHRVVPVVSVPPT